MSERKTAEEAPQKTEQASHHASESQEDHDTAYREPTPCNDCSTNHVQSPRSIGKDLRNVCCLAELDLQISAKSTESADMALRADRPSSGGQNYCETLMQAPLSSEATRCSNLIRSVRVPVGRLRLSYSLQGFDEYMNLVLDEAEEVSMKRKTRKPLGALPPPSMYSTSAVKEWTL